MIEETVSKWQCVADLIKECPEVSLGPRMADLFYEHPEQMLHVLSQYKFSAKLIGKNNHVVDIECGEGFGSYVLAKECGSCCGITSDSALLTFARKNFQTAEIDFLLSPPSLPLCDAIVDFSTHESIYSLEKIVSSLRPQGMVILGRKSSTAYILEKEMRAYFPFMFLFEAYGEVIKPAANIRTTLAPYCLIVACKK